MSEREREREREGWGPIWRVVGLVRGIGF